MTLPKPVRRNGCQKQYKDTYNDVLKTPPEVERVARSGKLPNIRQMLCELVTLKDRDTRNHRQSKECEDDRDAKEKEIDAAEHGFEYRVLVCY